jgi:hypothetical protein
MYSANKFAVTGANKFANTCKLNNSLNKNSPIQLNELGYFIY